MKTIIALAMVLLLAGQAGAGDFYNYVPPVNDPGHTIFYEPHVLSGLTRAGGWQSRDDLIRSWAKSGEICRVLNHQWQDIPHTTLEYRPDGSYPRHQWCPICDKRRVREWGEWREVK